MSEILTRRNLLRLAAALPLARLAAAAPTSRVALARCRDYDKTALREVFRGMFDQLGGVGKLVSGKTVTIKLNLTGSPALRVEGKPPSVTHYSHPNMVGVVVALLGEAGARRIRLVESFEHAPLQEMMLDAGWNYRALATAASNVEFLNTNFLDGAKAYHRFKVPFGGYIFPAFDLHPAFYETDVLVSMAKLKNHATCGVTLSTKNCFGNTPASIYGDDAGVDEPTETPIRARLTICHEGKRQPSKTAPSELDPTSPRIPEYRMPRIVVDIASARKVDLAIVDGITTIAGGEGPWIPGVRMVEPGVVLAGLNSVTTDTVSTAVMGYDPRAPKGTPPFEKCDNSLLLAERAGLGSADLDKIEVVGARIQDLRFPFAPAAGQSPASGA